MNGYWRASRPIAVKVLTFNLLFPIMRTTRAIHAVERLKTRSGNPQFAAISLSGGLFYLVDKSSGTDKKVSDPLTLDDFVKFVDGFGPPKPRKASKLDIAFEEQIKRSKGG